MKLLDQLNTRALQHDIRYLIIGGHAINAYGFSRNTGDLDLLVRKADRDYWVQTILAYGYQANQQHEVFCRFSSVVQINWPVDLMLVEDAVFEQLWAESREEQFDQVKVRIPHIKHMIALKLHALKQRQEHREDKDLMDIKSLLKYNKNIVSAAELRELCAKYNRADLYETLKKYI